MHFDYTRPGGVWLGAVTYADFADLDAKTFAAINGDGGGAWAPAAVIEIGGAGLTAILVGDNRLASGGTLTVDAGSQISVLGNVEIESGGFLILQPGATFSYPRNKTLVGEITLPWTGNQSWNTGAFAGAALQQIVDLNFTTYGIQVGDEIHFTVEATLLMHPSTLAWVRMSAGESTAYYTGGVDSGGATGLAVQGEKLLGPYYYGTSSMTLPIYQPISLAAKYVVAGGGDNHVYLMMSGKIQAYDGSTAAFAAVDQGLAALGDAKFIVRAQIWRP